MGTINTAATITTADIRELNAIGDAIFAEWFPNHRPGDPIPSMPPQHLAFAANAVGLRHRPASLLPISQKDACRTGCRPVPHP
jgi:hypothetical protein